MKNLLLFFLAFFPSIALAQHYEVSLLEIKDNRLPFIKSTNRINLANPRYLRAARLIIIGVNTAEVNNIKVKLHQDSTRIIAAEPVLSGDSAVYYFGNVIQIENAFDIYYNNILSGTIVFQVRGQVTAPVTDEVDSSDPDSVFQTYVGVLAGINFLGDNKFLSNITPVINLGGVVPLLTNRRFKWELDVNPYLGGEIDTRDSVSFIPALMLYGRAGLTINNYLHFDLGKTRITAMPFGFGIKFIPNLQDSNNVVLQHNIRFGLAARYSNILLLSGQITHGWHNLTSLSEKTYKSIFRYENTNITYLMFTGQFSLSGRNATVTNYIFFEWRGLLSSGNFPGFTNNRIFSIGFRKSFELSGSGVFASSSNQPSNRSSKVHYNFY